MRVILAPNSFRDGPSAFRVAEAMASGINRVFPDALIDIFPLADGGDGTLEVLARIFKGSIHDITVQDPLGRPVKAKFFIDTEKNLAVIEMAEASGLRLVANEDRDPFRSSSYGTGELIRFVLDMGVSNIFLGAGGSATIDAGAGALSALGAVFLNEAGHPLDPTPAGLIDVVDCDLKRLHPRLKEVKITVLSDVFTPLVGNSTVFGQQKGVKLETSEVLNQVLIRLDNIFRKRGYDDILETPWFGAGGGLAGGLAALAGAQVVGGAEFILNIAGLPNLLDRAEILLTGEGCFDATSFQGKLPVVVTNMAADKGVVSVIIAGQVAWEEIKPLPARVSYFSTTFGVGTLEKVVSGGTERIATAAEQVMRIYLSGRKGEVT
ncbi:hypothetical protein CN894_11765 [Bacillus thuringiensis]|uniref:glycerate kinase family protein n=1 Tax=Bacillus thuringiensis TaxID=1428 RepID=UPI000BFE6A5E|nr:glycerate kinase [Bacillus thuringiensis]PGH72156.1 hypothetical protein CN894_11765 [Bacillus thuringiensis]